MSLILPRLLDAEKYMLSELVYFHLPPELARRDFLASPLPLAEYVELIPRCRLSYYMKRDADGTHNRYFTDRLTRFREVLARSVNLSDAVLTGYVNDNYDAYGNTSGRNRSGLVALSFRDGENNLLVVYSGCEESCLSSILLDWPDCFRAALGVVTRQQRAALRFFNAQITPDTRGMGVIGHSKGGNLATHVYVNHLGEDIHAYCVNAQPYCWFILNAEQKAALKDERYELIKHAGDIVSSAGYQSCVSRVVPVNPYLGRGRVIDFHCYTSQLFDEQGNLAGDRILRRSSSRLRSRLFDDRAEEKAPSAEETLARFEKLLTGVPSLARLIHLALDEILLVGSMSSVAVLLRGTGARGAYLFPYIAKGKGAGLLHSVHLALDRGRMADTLEKGLPIYFPTIDFESEHLQRMGNILRIDVRSAGLIPIARDDEPYTGVLEILCDDDKIGADDLSLAFDMATLLSRRVSDMAGSEGLTIETPPLCEVMNERGERLSLARYEYRELGRDARGRFESLGRGALAEGDVMLFDGWRFDASDRSTLKNLYRRGVAVIDATQPRGATPRAMLRALERAFYTAEKAAEIAGLPLSKLDIPMRALDGYDKLCLKLAGALMRRAPLILFDERDCGEVVAALFRANLRLVCYDKLATVLVLRSSADTPAT